MINNKTAKQILDNIEAHHKAEVLKLMAVQLNTRKPSQQTIEDISAKQSLIADFRTLQESRLEAEIARPSLSQKVLIGAVSGLAGAATAGTTFLGMKLANTSPLGALKATIGLGDADSRSTTEQIASGAFAAGLGALVTKLMYDSYIKEYQGTSSKAQQAFQKDLEESGFISRLQNVSEKLSKDVVKLFRFRELLLIGEAKEGQEDLRKAFFKLNNFQIDDKATASQVNKAIEAYFLKSLNTIFNAACEEIYQGQQQNIDSEKNNFFIRWYHQAFDKPEHRALFSQKLQLIFMSKTRQYLISEMNQYGFWGKQLINHPNRTIFVGGLIVASVAIIAIGLASGPLGWAMLAAVTISAFVSSGLFTILAKKVVKQSDWLKFKKTAEERKAIQASVDNISHQLISLNKKIIERKATDDKSVNEVEQFAQVNKGFLNLFTKSNIAIGSTSGWLREYAIRFRHSKLIAVDLRQNIESIIEKSHQQSTTIITELLQQKKMPTLNTFVKDTQAFLADPKNTKMIEQYELKEKIKQQILDIVSHLPASQALPQNLIELYSQAQNSGGLEANLNELTQIRILAPSKADNALQPLSFKGLIQASKNLASKLQAFERNNPSLKILAGDPKYRNALGLSSGHGLKLNKLTPKSVRKYLDNSFDFLLSLANPVKAGDNILDKTTSVSNEYLLYRMLLIRQLAQICQPEYKKVSPEVKLVILNHFQYRFGLDPAIIFDDVQTQSLVSNSIKQKGTINVGTQQLANSDLMKVAQAIRLDMAYSSQNISPAMVLRKEAEDYQATHQLDDSLAIIGIDQHAQRQFQVIETQQGLAQLQLYLTDTKNFLDNLSQKGYLKSNGLAQNYRFAVTEAVTKNILNSMHKFHQALYTSQGELKPLSEIDAKQIGILIKTYKALQSFAKSNCYGLKPSTASWFIKGFDQFIAEVNPEQLNLASLTKAYQVFPKKLSSAEIQKLSAGYYDLQYVFDEISSDINHSAKVLPKLTMTNSYQGNRFFGVRSSDIAQLTQHALKP